MKDCSEKQLPTLSEPRDLYLNPLRTAFYFLIIELITRKKLGKQRF